MDDVVVLTGFMGVGKTATGRALAALLGWGFVDLDQEIETRAAKTVADIFAEEGEARFREMESEALARALEGRNVVVATGGGVLLREGNRRLLRNRTVFHLHASPEECLRRVMASGDRRPLLEVPDPREAVRRIYGEREGLYESVGQKVETAGKTPQDVARAIAAALGERRKREGCPR